MGIEHGILCHVIVGLWTEVTVRLPVLSNWHNSLEAPQLVEDPVLQPLKTIP